MDATIPPGQPDVVDVGFVPGRAVAEIEQDMRACDRCWGEAGPGCLKEGGVGALGVCELWPRIRFTPLRSQEGSRVRL